MRTVPQQQYIPQINNRTFSMTWHDMASFNKADRHESNRIEQNRNGTERNGTKRNETLIKQKRPSVQQVRNVGRLCHSFFPSRRRPTRIVKFCWMDEEKGVCLRYSQSLLLAKETKNGEGCDEKRQIVPHRRIAPYRSYQVDEKDQTLILRRLVYQTDKIIQFMHHTYRTTPRRLTAYYGTYYAISKCKQATWSIYTRLLYTRVRDLGSEAMILCWLHNDTKEMGFVFCFESNKDGHYRYKVEHTYFCGSPLPQQPGLLQFCRE